MLSELEIHDILQDFPNIELSYDTLVHKKVYDADIMFAIPEGIKCFVWFTTYKSGNVCFILELGDNKQIVHVRTCNQKFDKTLFYGTIFYGTLFKYRGLSCFTIEDIHYYKGKYIRENIHFSKKMEYMHESLTKCIEQNTYCTNMIAFGMPLFEKGTMFNKLLNEIEVLPYKIKIIQFRYLHSNKNNLLFMNYFKPGSQYTNMDSRKTNKAVFKVTPDIRNDIYHLYTDKNGKFEYFDTAFIPDYKTSVFMNKLFRIIKENDNLDKLEGELNDD